MKISALIKELREIKKREGDIEVTCTGSFLRDDHARIPDVFETTVENLIVTNGGNFNEKRVRLWL